MRLPWTRRGAGRRWVDGKTFRLADEVRYIQGRAAKYDSRIVTIGQLIIFSSQTGDAWLLDAAEYLAVPLARDGDPLPVEIADTDTSFSVGWSGSFKIQGEVFVYRPKSSGKVRSIRGYPTALIADQISNMFG